MKLEPENKDLYIFQDPKKVLSRAIQPPDYDNIGLALKSLQDSYALTMMQAKSTDIRITFLGKVYSNLPLAIKISKMVMLGRAFNCL